MGAHASRVVARAVAVGLLAACASTASAIERPPRGALAFETVSAADGVPLASVSCGSRGQPAVLLIHGFSLSYASFQPLFTEENCARWHIVAFDLRGHGRSGKPWTKEAFASSGVWANDVASIMAAHDLDRATLVGWSFGGYVVMDYIRHHGTARVHAINLVGSTAGLVPRLPQPAEVVRMESDLGNLMTSTKYRDNRRGAMLFASLMTATPQPREFTADITASVLMMPPYARELMRERDLDNQDLADDIDLRILLTAGAKDPSVPIPQLRSLAQAHENVSLSVFDAAGHMVFADDTPRFVAELEELVEQP